MPDTTTDTTPAPALGSSAVHDRLLELAERPKLADAGEIADALGIPRQSVWEYSRRGVLPVIRIGRMVRFDAAAVADFLAAGGTPFEGAEGEDDGADS